MPLGLATPVLVSLVTGLLLFLLIPLGWRYNDVPGVPQWLGMIGSAGAWAVFYGLSLMVFDPGLRELFEILNWLATAAAVVFIVGAGLKYTGYWRLVYSGYMAGLIGLAGGAWILMATNALGVHSFMWQDYTVRPVLGAAGVDYDPSLLFYATVGAAYAVIGGTAILVFNTMMRYGSLYRFHAIVIAIALLPVPAANLFWLYNLSVGPELALTPVAGLNLTPMSFLVTAVVTTTVLVPVDFFKITPATRRIAGSAVFDAVDSGVFLVNGEGHVLGLNEPAADIFGVVDEDTVLSERWQDVTEVDIEIPTDEPVEVTFPATPGRTHQVSTKPIEAVEGGLTKVVGYTVTIQDISRQRRRQQRLEVLNRVLRHNIRNDLTVIKGNAKRVGDTIEDVGTQAVESGTEGAVAEPGPLEVDREVPDRIGGYVDKIVESSESLSRTAEKARDMSIGTPEQTPMQASIDLETFLGRILRSASEEHQEATFDLAVPADDGLVTDPDLLRVVVENLVENAVVHNDAEEPRVDVTVSRVEDEDGDDAVEIAISDDGPGIPGHEIDVLEEGREEALQHGSGIGLWIVHWAVTDLGGEIDFTTDDGTTVTLTLSDPRNDDVLAGTPSRSGGEYR